MCLRYNYRMATVEVEAIKRNTDGATGYSDDALQTLLDAGLTVNEISGNIWQEKASSYAALVNVSESGSTRALGDLHKNALAMSKHFNSLTTVQEAAVVGKRTRTAVRG